MIGPLAWRNHQARASALAFHAPWDSDIDHEDIAEAARHVRATHLLLETIAASPAAGSTEPDHLDWLELAALADAALTAAVSVDFARLGLQQLQAVITPSKAAVAAVGDLDIDTNAFHAARIAHARRPARWNPAETSRDALNTGIGPQEFQPIDAADLPAEWAALDAALHDATGASLNALVAVLGTASTWDLADGRPTACVDGNELVEAAAAWSAIDADRIRAAVRLLTFDADRTPTGPPDYWRLEETPHRVATRPLVGSATGLWIMPGAVRATQELFIQHLADGRLLWPDLPKPVYVSLRRLRAEMDRQLERAVADTCRNLGFATASNIKPRKARARGARWPDTIGEIDVLAADPQRATIWVLEAKNPTNAVSAWHLRDAFNDFHEPRGHLERLERRIAAVAADRSAAARVLDVHGDDWAVRGAMVTRHVEIAAFAEQPRVTYVVIDDLHDLLTTSESDTPPGLWPIGVG